MKIALATLALAALPADRHPAPSYTVVVRVWTKTSTGQASL